MNTTQYKPHEYKQYLQMDHQKHLLVEGRDDYFFFQALFDEFLGTEWRDTHNIVIDKAESLISFADNSKGNREKVEHTIEATCTAFPQNKLAGFVDREFRKFEWETKLIDQIKKHHKDGQLVWARGHSIENYFLDADILRAPFRDVSGEIFKKAHDLFRQNIQAYLETAGAITLVGLQLD